jgi:23S rRNA pseudouridine1911/1915/1917 synthase
MPTIENVLPSPALRANISRMAKVAALEVLYEDNHLLIVNKPAGLATQGVTAGTASVVTRAKEYIKRKYKKPGNVFIGVVSRLDAAVSGALVLARTSKAADRLTKQFQSGQVEKYYYALVPGSPNPAAGELSHWLLKSDRERRMTIVPPRTRGAQHARLTYRILRETKQGTLLEVRLLTGRKHQIRVQLAEIGCVILGDRKYGNRSSFADGAAIALHCVRLALEHPTTKVRIEATAPLPKYWPVKETR